MLPNSLCSSIHATATIATPSVSPLSTFSFHLSPSSLSSHSPSLSFSTSPLHCYRLSAFAVFGDTQLRVKLKAKEWKVNCSISDQSRPIKVMISGPPSSGKGTQCDMIAGKFGLVHISTGDILRAELSAGTEIGNQAKEFMNSGRLVPDEIVTALVVSRLSQEDVKRRGWLLDGYPRTFAQAESLEKLQIRPDICIVLEVPDEVLVNRVVARRQDPVTKKIYNLNYDPPETEEIKARLITRPDDEEDKVKLRLQIYKKNAEAMMSTYSTIIDRVDGNRPKEVVFKDIDSLLSKVLQQKVEHITSGKLTRDSNNSSKLVRSTNDKWRGIPTRLNNVPHSKEIRKYFYDDVLQATHRAISDGMTRLKVEINIPELNPEQDVYRIGTLVELVRSIALSFADDGKRVKVCVQGSMGEGALVGMPLQLAGTRKILEVMDWGDDGALGTFIKIASIGSSQVDEQDDMFILVAPQNAVGNCIIDDLKAMTDAAGERPVILINPRLKDLPSSSGIMQAMGREERLKYAASFRSCYFFRLLYYAGTQYPIMGAIRFSYPYPYELYKRVDEDNGKEKYVLLSTFAERPTIDEINDTFEGKPRKVKQASGIRGFLDGILGVF